MREPGVYSVKIHWVNQNKVLGSLAFWTGDHWRFVRHTPLDLGKDIPDGYIVEIGEYLGEEFNHKLLLK